MGKGFESGRIVRSERGGSEEEGELEVGVRSEVGVGLDYNHLLAIRHTSKYLCCSHLADGGLMPLKSLRA